jgi:ATP-dependent helicase/nuclease subunit B
MAEVETDAWLRQGGFVVAASERAARALSAAFHRRRRSEGLSAWPAPQITDWKSFVRAAWQERSRDGELLLNRTQEQSLWADLAAGDVRLATRLAGPRYRLADLAMDAHELLCGYSPGYLRARSRTGWQNDAAAFGRWLDGFLSICQRDRLLSPARLPLKLVALLEGDEAGKNSRAPLLLAGFDRILPMQKAVFDAWGVWQPAPTGERSNLIRFHEAAHGQAELAACALWAKRRIASNPEARLLVITHEAAKRRGEMERAFLHSVGATGFEFSLGVPLGKVPLPRAGLTLLNWLAAPVAEHELDWLFSTGRSTREASEDRGLQEAMRGLRARGMQRPEWSLQASTVGSFADAGTVGHARASSLPSAWTARMVEATERLAKFGELRSPVEWAEFVPRVMDIAGWPGVKTLSSAEFQAAHRFQQAIEACGSLGFDGRRMGFFEFFNALERAMAETLFAVESGDASILIAGPAESAGLTADGLWFLGASEDSWPQGGSIHPLLPIEVQREAGMPHTTAMRDWDVAQVVTQRLLTSCDDVNFSYSRQMEGLESRPSRLVMNLAGPPQEIGAEFDPEPATAVRTEWWHDSGAVPFAGGEVSGGSAVMTAQSNCSFKAFASARLGAVGWEAAQAGLTPSQRGQLLHAVMHRVWAGKPDGIRTSVDLLGIPDRESWVARHVARVFADPNHLPKGMRERMPARYLQLEEQRLTRLIAAWLDFEATRVPFEVLETEGRQTATIAGLTFQLRMDRLDRLNDESVLVIDYKTGDMKPKTWELDRPEDVQLPLYAGFALTEDQPLGGLVFAKLRPGCNEFAGRVGAPASTLFSGLKANTALMRECLTLEQVMDWRDHLEKLARDFLAGRAEVNPRDPPKTCERCGLHSVCRIQDGNIACAPDEDEENGDAVADYD